MTRLEAWAPDGFPEVAAGDDLATLLLAALGMRRRSPRLRNLAPTRRRGGPPKRVAAWRGPRF